MKETSHLAKDRGGRFPAAVCRCADFCFRYRLLLGLLALFLCVMLELSGSSIGMWNAYIPDASLVGDGVLLGTNRPIRSDEWAVFTPMALSQYGNDFGLRSSLLRAADTDVFMVCGQPVRDWSILFRPFQIGYLFLSPAKGLSFYWFGKLIALFLVSLEFGLLLTSKDKWLSCAYAFAVTLSPVVAWWFSTNAFPDMLVYGQGILLCVSAYMETKTYGKRVLLAAGLVVLCGAYLLVLYPAWQVPFFYVFLSMGLWLLVSRWKVSSFSVRKDVPILIASLLLLTVCLGLIAYRSRDVIRAVMHSTYPGQRQESGGMGPAWLFRSVGSLFFPFRSEGLPDNTCELALFFDCFPLGLFAAVLLRRRGVKKDGLISCLLGLLVFLGLFVVLGFPKTLGKLLLNNSKTVRALVALSYVNLLLLFRSLAGMKEQQLRLRGRDALACAAGIAACMAYYSYRWVYSGYYSVSMLLICFAVLAALGFSAFTGSKSFCGIMIALSLVISGTVNPLRSGLDLIENNTLGRAIRSCAEQSDGKWLAVSDHWETGNFLLMNGAAVINCTNTYINPALWEKLDPEGTYEDLYNRYAHITVTLADVEQPQIELPYPDQIHVVMNVEDLVKIGAEYLVSEKDLTCFGSDAVQLRPVFSSPNVAYGIYHVESASQGDADASAHS